MMLNDDAAAAEFLQTAPLLSLVREAIVTTSPSDRADIAKRLTEVVRDYYVHLPLKCSSLGIDPVRELELLVDDVPLIETEDQFFRRTIEILSRLRDRHTTMMLPAPRSQAIAFLPFAVESCFDANRQRHLIVSKLMCDVGDPEFKPGVELQYWNGTSIPRQIEAVSWQTDGANPYARIALALRTLTVRPLGYMLAPDEDWVTLTYLGDKGTRSLALPWRVYFADGTAAAATAGRRLTGAAALQVGLDHRTAVVNAAWYDLFGTRGAQAAAPGEIDTTAYNLSAVQAKTVETASGPIGYVRIFSLETEDPGAFLSGMTKVLEQLPKTGLILDVRANPGGAIPAGEGILELLSHGWPTFEPVSFRNTTAARRLGSLPSFSPWKRSLDIAPETGEVFSQGFPLSANTGVQHVYQGPVIAIIDSLAYSATDFLVAGLQDNGLAHIVGVDPVTGAGGANVWSLSTLASMDRESGGNLQPLPAGVELNLAVRRSVRVGARAGIPVEGIGEFADHVYLPSRDDVLGKNQDLVEYCARLLKTIRA